MVPSNAVVRNTLSFADSQFTTTSQVDTGRSRSDDPPWWQFASRPPGYSDPPRPSAKVFRIHHFAKDALPKSGTRPSPIRRLSRAVYKTAQSQRTRQSPGVTGLQSA